MITIYHIDVERNKLVFEGMCDQTCVIDRMSIISPTHAIDVGWVELWVCDYLSYKGPYPWFKNGGMNFSLSMYMNFKICFTAFDDASKWFHGSHVRLVCQYEDGNVISTNYKNRFDEYVK